MTTADPGGHPDLVPRDAVDMSFTDLLCSCDVVVSKPGYGIFAEAGANGLPMLYVPRPDWPESPAVIAWLDEHGRCLPIEAAELFDAAALGSQLQTLLSRSAKPPIEPTGAEQGAQALLEALADAGYTQ